MPSPEPASQTSSASPTPTSSPLSAANRPTLKPTDRAETTLLDRNTFGYLKRTPRSPSSRTKRYTTGTSNAMASTSPSYLGRVLDKRRLGDDLDLLALWTRTFKGDYPIHSYYLTQLSAEDRAQLFSGPAQEFRLRECFDRTLKLETIQDEVDRIDSEVIDMIRSSGYRRSEARCLELLNAIEDAHHSAEGAAAMALSSALLSGVDGPKAEAYSRTVAKKHLDSVAATVKARWKAERIEGLKGTHRHVSVTMLERPTTEARRISVDQMMAEAAPLAAFWRTQSNRPLVFEVEHGAAQSTTVKQGITSVSEAGHVAGRSVTVGQYKTQRIDSFAQTKITTTFGDSLAELSDNEATPKQRPAAKATSPNDSLPDHGSETSAETARWNSPLFSPGDFPSSPDFDIDPASTDDSVGGVSLLPDGLVEELGLKSGSGISASTPSNHFGTHASGGHLGAGLQQAFAALRGSLQDKVSDATLDRVLKSTSSGPDLSSAPHDFFSNPRLAHQQMVDQFVNPVTPIEASPPPITAVSHEDVDSWFAQKELVDTIVKGGTAVESLYSASAHISKHSTLTVAEKQPWKEFTCYEVTTTKLSIDQLVPKYWTTRAEKERYVRHKIGELKHDDAKLRSDRFTGSVARNPVHIFIDLSNIIIGFYDSMKESRGIPVTKRVMAPAFSFKNFDTVLTRDRNVAKRVVAGSLANSYKRWPGYMLQAQELQYEMNILERVPKPAASPVRKRRGKTGNRDLDVSASGADTSGDDYFGAPMKNGEQGVDELLHLKILQSAMDTDQPATMVLATGDAATAQYSDGFKKNIERVLTVGWHIELYGWRRNISAAWRDPEFAKQWGHQFKIIELDEFCEELFDMTIESLEP